MPRIRRRFLIDPSEVGIYHCINRCVRRSFLCGSDPVSGKNYEHRRQWMQDRIQFLAGQFGLDVLGFAVKLGATHYPDAAQLPYCKCVWRPALQFVHACGANEIVGGTKSTRHH